MARYYRITTKMKCFLSIRLVDYGIVRLYFSNVKTIGTVHIIQD